MQIILWDEEMVLMSTVMELLSLRKPIPMLKNIPMVHQLVGLLKLMVYVVSELWAALYPLLVQTRTAELRI